MQPSINADKPVRLWLYAIAALTVIMVLVGGATRLTDSGLSITEWAPISGIVPPFSHEDWMQVFAKYQTTGEFKLQNHAMTLPQFETIFWWEWGHRFLGRVIGLGVLLPLIFFWLRGWLTSSLKRATSLLFVLVCLQGAIGWWMVKSGLINRVDVSQIRLAVHLTTAYLFFVATIWVARGTASHSCGAATGAFWQGGALVALILLQVFVGGLVAGLDAGKAYNTWPLMDGQIVPTGLFIVQPWWSNLTDNAMTVQFVHRCIAILLFIAVIIHLVWMARFQPSTTHLRRAMFLFVLSAAQAIFGIVTLLMQVPISWALLHQIGALLVLGFATAHWRALRPAKETAFRSPQASLEPVPVPVPVPVHVQV